MVALRTLLIFVVNALLLVVAPFRGPLLGIARRQVRWLELELEGSVHIFSPRKSFLRRLLRARHHAPYVTAYGLGRALDAALELPKVEGVVVKLHRIAGGWAAIDALRDDLLRVRRAGKTLVVHLVEGGGLRELFVASAAERIYLAPESTLALGGLSVESRYVRGALDRLGVEVEVHRRAEYKSAAEFVSREQMSDESRAQLTELLESYYVAVVEAYASARGLPAERVRALFDEPLLAPRRALEVGLVDGLAYEDELRSRLSKEGKPPRLVGVMRARKLARARLFLRLRRGPRLALVRVEGAIVDSDKGRAGLPRLRDELRRARADRDVRGVLLFIDSPGGSAHASDLLHREIVRLREKKPVVAYFANVAASGGYYLGVGAPEIVAGRLSVTGSIGVLAARVAAVDLLERLGVRTEVVRTGPHADLFSPHRRTSEAEQAMLEEHVEAHYRAFVAKVAAGRGRATEEIEPHARGRVYTGEAALERGLVDSLGGPEVAIARLAEMARIPKARFDAIELSPVARRGASPVPEPPSVAEALAEQLGLGPALELLSLARGGGSVLYYAADFSNEAASAKEER